MKRFKNFLRKGAMVALVMMGVTAVKAQEVKFQSDIDMMTPMSYSPKNGLTGFSFDMRNDSVFVHLPYIGQVYTPTFNNDGLNFNEPVTDLKQKDTKKKDGKELTFTVRHDIVKYDFRITLWDNNHIDINMQPSNAQSCSYMGSWEE